MITREDVEPKVPRPQVNSARKIYLGAKMVKGGVIPLKLVVRQQSDHESQIRLAQMNIRKITIVRNPSKQSAEVKVNIKQFKARSMYSTKKACLDTVHVAAWCYDHLHAFFLTLIHTQYLTMTK